MNDRNSLQDVPYPFVELQTDEPMPLCDVLQQMHTLLQQMHGLAGVCYSASLYQETMQQDLSQSLGVLYGYLEAARALFERWQQASSPTSPGNEPHC